MESLEIVCESCDSRMRLSESLLTKVAGKSGRVTCRACQNKIVLDATDGEVRVTKGGYELRTLEIEEVEAPPSVDPLLSVLPLEPVASANPPLAAQSEGNDEAASEDAPESFRVHTPGPDDLAAAMRFSRKAGEEFEAPVPDFGSDGSLSPHAIDDEEEDLVPLGREFNSSPFASERDASYQSLFPEMRPRASVAEEAPPPVLSRTPSPPKRGELRRMKSDPEIFAGDLGTAPAVASTVVEMGPDGRLINQSDKKRSAREPQRSGNFIPWTVAAIALLGLGVSVTVNRSAPVVVEKTEQPVEPALAASTIEPAAAVEEPATAVVEETEGPDDASDSLEEPSPMESAESAGAPQDAASLPLKEPTTKPSSARSEVPPSEHSAASDSQAAEVSERGDAEDSSVDSEETEADAEQPALSPFSASAASTALREATALASACRKPGDPTGSAKVVVTFAPSGRVTRAAVTGAPFAGTETGGCIASRFRTARVPGFSGEHVTVSKTVSIR